VHTGSEIVSAGPKVPGGTGLVNVEKEPDYRVPDRVGTVVVIRDLLAAADVAVGWESGDGDVVSSAILPVIGSRPAVG
jgi:hypothetical protein